MNYTGPKVRLSRRFGVALTPKAAKIMEKRGYPPGQHGRMATRFSKVSDFKRQLQEKQLLRAQYNIHERQLRNYYEKASSRVGNTPDNLIQLLETRLDSLVYRAGLARSIYAARQYVTHGHLEVNGKRVNIPSYNVEIGDVITVKEKSRKMPCFTEALETTIAPPAYLDRNEAEMSAKLLYLPKREEVPTVCEMSLVIEFYSR